MYKTLRIYFPLIILFLLLPAHGTAQQSGIPIGDPFENYLRILQHELNDEKPHSFNIRPISAIPNTQYSIPTTHPWSNHPFFTDTSNSSFQIFTPTTTFTYNSNFPAGQNDGAMWQGRGLNSSLTFGAGYSHRFFEFALRPEIGVAQNREFELHPLSPPDERSEFASYRRGIDLPQRFGDATHSWLHPGQSYAKLKYAGISTGVSTQNIWIGPALYNPLMLSNNAPGFLHGFLQTDEPVSTPIGNIEGKIFWGFPEESDYFLETPHGSDRFFSGATFIYSPSFIPGLHLGAFRGVMEYIPDDGIGTQQIFSPFRGHSDANFSAQVEERDGRNQMASVFARYKAPNSGFEAWFEWGRNDNFRDGRDLSIGLEHSRAYLLGFAKPFILQDSRMLALSFEMTQLEPTRSVSYRTTTPPYYQHYTVTEGWTNRGQVMGAGIMMGSNNQKIDLKLYENRGMVGISFNRVEHLNWPLERHERELLNMQDDDVDADIGDLRQVEFRPGLHALLFLPHNLELQGDIYPSFFRNRYNLFNNHERNLNMQVSLRYQLPGFAR